MQQNKNFDAIGVIKIIQRKPAKHKAANLDSIVRVRRRKPVSQFARAKLSARKFWLNQRFYLPIALSAVLILSSFAAGAYFTWRTDKSSAEAQNSQSSSPSSRVPSLPVVEGVAVLGPLAQVPNEVLFNLTLDQLESYLAEALKTPALKEAERLADRKIKLKQYLEQKKSPFVNIVDILAELKHWKMVLAISNSESTLGRSCDSNNCSGIGVKPGHPLWRRYASTREWAKDLDKLIDSRYKDWTLEEMNGVYNQPGSKNWLYASKQVLEELQEQGIE